MVNRVACSLGAVIRGRLLLMVVLTVLLPSALPSGAAVRAPAASADIVPLTFSDVTTLAGIGLGNYRTWGTQWGDYNNDGYADLVVGGHYGRSPLFRNNHDGTFTDVTDQAKMAKKTDRHGCAWGDYNADGLLDLYCATGAHKGAGDVPNLLYKNVGDGGFKDVAAALGVSDASGRGRSANWLDYDGDGTLDLYLANELREGYPSRLWRGTGAAFVDVSAEAGVADQVPSTASGWSDYDGDADADLLVTALDRLILYQNRSGTFSDVTAQANLVSEKSNSASWGDFDNDGNLDLFVAPVGKKARLYRNLGEGTFQDVTSSSGIRVSRARVGLWGDYDNDGDLDLFVVTDRNFRLGLNLPDALYSNNGDGTFTNIATAAGVAGPTDGSGDSAAWADYNNDGFLDLFVTNGLLNNIPPGPVALYRNNGNGNHWLELKLRGSTANTFGYGAKVWVRAGSKTQFRQLTDNVVQYGQSDQIVHFGLGRAATVERVTIQWPNGMTQELAALAADQVLTLVQP